MRLFGAALIVLVLFWGGITDPSDAIHLIHQVSDKYRGQRSVELSGHLSTAPPGTGSKILVEAVYAQADHSFVPKASNLFKWELRGPFPSQNSGREWNDASRRTVGCHRRGTVTAALVLMGTWE